MRVLIPIVCLLAVTSCAGTTFNASESPVTPQATYSPTPTQTPNSFFTPSPYIPTTNIPTTTLPTSKPATPRPPQLTTPPSTAQRKGSFTIWTDPLDPRPGVYYDIVIEVKLPSSVSTITQTDLTGCVLGTDDYVYVLQRGDYAGAQKPKTCAEAMALPAKDFDIGFFKKPRFQSSSGYAQLRIPIPGGQNMVEDKIEVKSRLLNETQAVKIVF